MCAARYARRIAAWVSATLPGLNAGTRALAQSITPMSNAHGFNGAQNMAGPSRQRNADILTTPDLLSRRAGKATNQSLRGVYLRTHEALRAEMIRKEG
jgi:hypothetical protein